MKAIELIQYLGHDIEDQAFLEFLAQHHFSTKKFPKKGRGPIQGAKWMFPNSNLHGVAFCFGFENAGLNLEGIAFYKPESNGIDSVYKIDYPFGLHLNQKIDSYERILGDPIGWIEPQFHDYYYKKYGVTIYFDPKDLDKKIKEIEISIKR